MSDHKKIKTIGQLKSAGYKFKTIKDELRGNLIEKLRNKENVFEGIWGYEETVENNTLDVFMKQLRAKIDEGYDTKLIQTVRGFGYRLSPVAGE